ncbi:MAG: protein kinase, partial [Myxococcota bacterium]
MGNKTQKCTACGTLNDVSYLVSGQKTKCKKCNLPIFVQHPEILPTKIASQPSQKPAAAPEPVTEVEPSIPPVIPGFEVLEVIGKGGMGTVYKARQLSLSRVVAVKVLARQFASEKDFIERFDREAAALAKLSHPNIVPIIDKGSFSGVYFFVMDFVQGVTLRQQLREGRLGQEEAIKVALQVCRAISYAHSQGVVHRDLKPENVLLDREKNVRIVDFGLADIVGSNTCHTLTGSGMAMGTAHYMAPEQRRDAKHVDHRADIYSLGIMIYEMLTGEIPQGHFKKPSEHTTTVNPAFDRITIKCLQPSADDRYQTADEVARDLRAVLPDKGEPASPAVPRPAERNPATQQADPRREPVRPPQSPEGFSPAPSFSPAAKKSPPSDRPAVRPISVRRRHVKKTRLII